MLNKLRIKHKRYFIISFSFLLVYLLIGNNLISVDAKQESQKLLPKPAHTGRIIYVYDDAPSGGIGSKERPYKTINQAYIVSNPGDTIYVFNGTYNEALYIEKDNLTFIGESNKTTAICGIGVGWTCIILSDYVTITNFSFGSLLYSTPVGNIKIEGGNFCTISNIVFQNLGPWLNVQYGVELLNSSYCIISNCIFTPLIGDMQFGYSIYMDNCSHTTLTDNIGYWFILGIYISNSSNNVIERNTNHAGTILFQSHNNIVKQNTLYSNLQLYHATYNVISFNSLSQFQALNITDHSDNNEITYNNFGRHGLIAQKKFGPQIYFSDSYNIFDHNYWSRPRLSPKVILGHGKVISIQVDWHPTWKLNTIS